MIPIFAPGSTRSRARMKLIEDKMKTADIRKAYLDFFAARDHVAYPSDSLVPSDDPSLLFTGAGMNQFKDMFMGKGTLSFTRATTAQKCFRTGDIENVGKTPCHHTFFEMMGNFSFGDYFKAEAIAWAWEFLVKVMGLATEKLAVSVYRDDDEAFDIWRKLGVPAARIFRMGEHDNFWPADAPSLGPNGVCGPCSEIFFDTGPCPGYEGAEIDLGHPSKRWNEIWNLVFTQFNRLDGGRLEPLPQKNIDTGMGLERMAAVMQGVKSNFETDLLRRIVDAAAEIAKIEYNPTDEKAVRLRRIADHVRAVTFAINDGALPDADGRGYVIRKLIRRAFRDGRQLNIRDGFLYRLVPLVAELYRDHYVDLADRVENVANIVKLEEERFAGTLDTGVRIIDELVEKLKKSGQQVLPGAEMFRLHDTYGFPPDLCEAILDEHDMTVDYPGYEKAREQAAKLAQSASGFSGEIFETGPLSKIKETCKPTVFDGYERSEVEGEVVGMIEAEADAISRGKTTDALSEGRPGVLVLNRTGFYAASGGQAGDTGKIVSAGGEFAVERTDKAGDFHLHVGRVVRGTFSVGDGVRTVVDDVRRNDIRRNHTATHLLHWAIRETLGKTCEQAGSLVLPERLRFDFTCAKALTAEEIARIETLVNERILGDDPVETSETDIGTARKMGAMALFGEKYGAKVRMVAVGGVSRELCGGTHIARASQIGSFVIVSEEAVASGVRRIEAVTGGAAIREIQRRAGILRELTLRLSSKDAELPRRVDALLDQAQEAQKEIRRLKQAVAKGDAGVGSDAAEKIDGISVVARIMDGSRPDELRLHCDQLRGRMPDGVFVLGTRDAEKANLVVAVGPAALSAGVDAGVMIRKLAPIVGGSGGGRKDMAMAGGKNPAALDDLMRAVPDVVRGMLAR